MLLQMACTAVKQCGGIRAGCVYPKDRLHCHAAGSYFGAGLSRACLDAPKQSCSCTFETACIEAAFWDRTNRGCWGPYLFDVRSQAAHYLPHKPSAANLGDGSYQEKDQGSYNLQGSPVLAYI